MDLLDVSSDEDPSDNRDDSDSEIQKPAKKAKPAHAAAGGRRAPGKENRSRAGASAGRKGSSRGGKGTAAQPAEPAPRPQLEAEVMDARMKAAELAATVRRITAQGGAVPKLTTTGLERAQRLLDAAVPDKGTQPMIMKMGPLCVPGLACSGVTC